MRSFSISGLSSPSRDGRGSSYQDNDTSSQVSDMSYTTEGSWMRRLANPFSGNEPSIDDAMRDLYGDSDALEERCRKSLNSLSNLEHADEAARRKSLAMEEAMLNLGVKHSRTAEESIDSLEGGFFTEDFDPIKAQLDRIQNCTDDEMTETFMSTIEETDISKDAVVSKLFVMIESNYDELMSCMTDVHAIDIDLAKTNVQITNSIRKLRSADTLIVSGTLQITKLHNMKQRLRKVQTIAAEVLKLKEMYRATLALMNSGDLGGAATTAHDLLNALQNEMFEQVVSVAHLGDNVQNMIPLIRFKSDKALYNICCGNFSAVTYGSILSSYLMLDQMQETMGVQIIDPSLVNQNGSPESCHTDTRACADGLAERVLRYLCLYINICIRNAVAEFLPAAGKEKVLSLDVISVHIEDILGYLSPETSVQTVVRTCELLAEVVHTHYLITQWHRTPFDVRNTDNAFLHRCPNELQNTDFDGGFDDDDEEEDEEEESDEENDDSGRSQAQTQSRTVSTGGNIFNENPVDGSPPRRKRHSSSRTPVTLKGLYDSSSSSGGVEDIGERLRAARVALASQQLTRSRSHLWSSVESAMVMLLSAMHTSSNVTVEDFLSMNWCIQTLVKIGMEFCGSSSRHIAKTMKEKCVDYFKEIHRDSFDQLRHMVECETWSSVPVKVADMGGIIGIIKSNVRRRDPGNPAVKSKIRLQGMIRETEEIKRRKTAALAAKYAPSDSSPPKLGRQGSGSTLDLLADDNTNPSSMMAFGKYGNPLQYVPFDDELEAGDEAPNNPQGNSGSGAYFSPLGSDFLSLLLEEDSSGLARARKTQDKSSAVVVTQSALNGLAKFTGKYLLMMHLMSAASMDIFLGLKQLFEYYLCAVFNGFVPYEDRKNVLHPPPRTSPQSPPPMQSKDFDGLHTCLLRSLIEIVAVSPGAQIPLEASSPSGGGAASGITAGLGGVGSMVGSLYSGTAANIYSSLSASLNLESSPMDNVGSAASVLGPNYVPTPGIIRVVDVLKVPVPVKNASDDNFFALNERIVAAESCWFVAKVLTEIRSKVEQLLPEADRRLCNECISDFQLVAGQLRSLVYRSMCPLLIKQNQVFTDIVDESHWETKKMREDTHQWVDVLVSKCSDVWQYISRGDDFADASTQVREQVWLEVCQCAFDTVLEGFGRVKKCSTEGRASMAMDNTALHTSLDSVHVCRPPRGKVHVDNYVRASYLSEDELIHWVNQNWQLYTYRHLTGLLSQNLSSVMKKKKLSNAIASLDAMYEQADEEEESKGVAGLFSKF